MTVRAAFRTEREIDVVVRGADGKVYGIEIKSSESAFTRFDAAAKQQFANDRWINQFGADVVGHWAPRIPRVERTIKILWKGGSP